MGEANSSIVSSLVLCDTVHKYGREAASRQIMRTGTEITKRSRGRPRGFITEEVLEKVRGVFMAKGFSGASLDELAAAAGLNRPSLYAAFGDKEQLYIATLRFYGTKSIEGLDAILAGPGTIQQRLARVYSAAIDLYTAPPHRPGCMIVGTAAVESPTYPQDRRGRRRASGRHREEPGARLRRQRPAQEARPRGARPHGRRHHVRHRHPRAARRQGRPT